MYYNQNYNSYPQSYPNSIYGSSFNPQMQPQVRSEIVKVNGENVDQTTINDTVQSAVQDIHDHLSEQDEKITKILQLLEGKK